MAMLEYLKFSVWEKQGEKYAEKNTFDKAIMIIQNGEDEQLS